MPELSSLPWPTPLPVTLQIYGLPLVRASSHSCVPQLQQGSARSPLRPPSVIPALSFSYKPLPPSFQSLQPSSLNATQSLLPSTAKSSYLSGSIRLPGLLCPILAFSQAKTRKGGKASDSKWLLNSNHTRPPKVSSPGCLYDLTHHY